MKYFTIENANAAAIIERMTTRQPIGTFIMTGIQIDAGHPDTNIYTVRGWLMAELERRNPEAFDAWLDSETCDDEDLQKYFLS